MQKLHDLFHYHFTQNPSIDGVLELILSFPKVAELEELIGHSFNRKDLLLSALVHPSLGNEIALFQKINYQRLEFLGDSVLGAILAEKLYSSFPDSSEGDLSKMKAHLAGQEMIAKLGLGMQLENFIIFGKGTFAQLEVATNVSKGLIRAVSDTVEALLGATFLDSGLEQAKIVFEKFTSKYSLAYQKDYLDMATFGEFDPKSRLQEKCLTAHKMLPVYECRTRNNGLECTLIVNGQVAALGHGLSKKEAEQSAARQALATLFKN